jgi:uncharacterized protein (DUF1778 family)
LSALWVAAERESRGRVELYCQQEYIAVMPESRSERLQLRISPLQREILTAAAEAQHQTLTDYVVSHAVQAAKQDLADRRFFGIDDAAWTEFNALLERPAEHKPKLEKLLSQPGPWVK